MLPILLAIKFIIYTDITKVKYNRIPIIIISSLSSLLVFSLIYRLSFQKATTIALIFYIAVSILLFVDSTYFSQFGTLTSVSILQQITQISSVGPSIKKLLNPKKAALIIDIIIISITYILFSIIWSPRGLRPVIRLPLYGVSTLGSLRPLTIGIILIVILYYYKKEGQLISIKNQEFFIYHITDIRDCLFEDEKVRASEIFNQSDIDQLRNRINFKKGKFTGIGQGKNLIVLQVEALQNFAIDFKYNGQELTPNLNKFIKDKSTIYYDNYYQSVGKANTADAEFASNNSLYPSLRGPTYMEYEKNTFYGLPWLLRDNGYTAWAFHGYEKDYWNRNNAYINQGFQRFISQEDFKFEETIGFGIRDEEFLKQSIDYLKELDNVNENPFYAFMLTLSSHTPFHMPEQYKVLKIKEEHKGSMLGDYINAIHYTDKYIGRFLEDLKAEGLYENSVIVIYGDHYAIPVNSQEDKVIMTELLGKPYDYDEMMNIPLTIHLPGQEVNQTINKLSSQIDFYPTIANIMGYKIDKGLIFGKDITNNTQETYVFPQIYIDPGSVITKDAVFEMSKDGIYNHSQARKRPTGQPLEINQFRELNQKALKDINLSNYILRNNLIKESEELRTKN
ncbi:MAG: LTA synthase family protein [Tissierellia bacterium]|nr:LTA synthase family protein [Tissierellia bacterium]